MPQKTRGKAAAPAWTAVKRPKMRPALAKAVDLIVEQGTTQREAARRVGMTETALGRALKREAIADYMEARYAQEALDADAFDARAKILAKNRGVELMFNAKSEQVQARMVELFAGKERNGPLVSLTIGAQSKGYEYAPPGSTIVEVRSPLDSPSSADDDQALDMIEDAETLDPSDDPNP